MTGHWEGQFVRLRAIEPDDWQIHYEWDKDAEPARNVDYIWFPSSTERAKKWALEQSTAPPDGDNHRFVIETLDDEHAGVINAHDCNPRTGTFEYGLAIRPEHQRKGYAQDAIKILLNHYFNELRYQKVTADVFAFNQPSIDLHEKLGFQLEGRIRRMIFTHGQHHDLLVYGMTVEEFREHVYS